MSTSEMKTRRILLFCVQTVTEEYMTGGQIMKCPSNDEHRGIKVIKQPNPTDEKYAKAVCRVCGDWIGWLSKADYKHDRQILLTYAMSPEPECVEEATAQESDVERMVRCVKEAEEILEFTCGTNRNYILADILSIAFQLFNSREK
jgi:hypothetical protein